MGKLYLLLTRLRKATPKSEHYNNGDILHLRWYLLNFRLWNLGTKLRFYDNLIRLTLKK